MSKILDKLALEASKTDRQNNLRSSSLERRRKSEAAYAAAWNRVKECATLPIWW